nr:myosin regulatory light chain 10 isoform X2 [Globicephala melas]
MPHLWPSLQAPGSSGRCGQLLLWTTQGDSFPLCKRGIIVLTSQGCEEQRRPGQAQEDAGLGSLPAPWLSASTSHAPKHLTDVHKTRKLKRRIKEKLMTQADRFSEDEIKQMFAAFPPDVCGNLDYRNLCYVITHGEEKD